MPQRKEYPPYKNRKPQKFIPRRDLFPEDDFILPNKLTPVKKEINKKQDKQRDKNIEKPYIRHQNKSDILSTLLSLPIPLLLLIGFTAYIFWSRKKNSVLTKEIKVAIDEVIDNPNYADMLRSIGPYLEDKDQDIIYAVVGILESASIIKDIVNRTYQNKIRSMSRRVPEEPIAKVIEMLKSIKPYVPESKRYALESAVKIFDVADKISHNIEIYKNNRLLAGNKKLSPIDNINEIIKVIKPIIPENYSDKADKIITVMKMAETFNKTESNKNKKKKTQTTFENNGKGHITDSSDSKDEEKKSANADQILDSLKSVMTEEQKQSMDVIMKMAQLLAQPSGDDKE